MKLLPDLIRLFSANKIRFRVQLSHTLLWVFLLGANTLPAQDTARNQYGLWVIKDAPVLNKTIRVNAQKAMANCKQIPGIVMELRYSGTNNFMGKPLYPKIKTTYLRKPVFDSLLQVQKELKEQGLGLKIFDAYRPYSVTERMWEPVKDDRYAADPRKGSGHNRGIAVDLTLIQLADGRELPMGTGFDNFSDTAHHGFTGLSNDILQNRLLLKTVMEKYGFKALSTEWWHYYMAAFADFELLDLTFRALKKSALKKQDIH